MKFEPACTWTYKLCKPHFSFLSSVEVTHFQSSGCFFRGRSKEPPNAKRARNPSAKRLLTFDFFIWNGRSKSSACESLFHFTSAQREVVLVLLCAHIQKPGLRRPRAQRAAPRRTRTAPGGATLLIIFTPSSTWAPFRLGGTHSPAAAYIQTARALQEQEGTSSFIMARVRAAREPPSWLAAASCQRRAHRAAHVAQLFCVSSCFLHAARHRMEAQKGSKHSRGFSWFEPVRKRQLHICHVKTQEWSKVWDSWVLSLINIQAHLGLLI